MILICFGTRPEWLKIKPLLNILDRDDYRLLFTGQHTDLLEDIKVDFEIKLSKTTINRLDEIISQCMLQFPHHPFTEVVVQGDTASAFGCAVAAFNRKIPVYYMEAGLRSGDMNHPYPEEGYRQMVSRISTLNFCPTTLSRENLQNENIYNNLVVGNTVLDNLIEYKDKCKYTDTVLVTLHRNENRHIMRTWFIEINKLAIQNPNIEFILPLHPNPQITQWEYLLTNVNVVNPLEHNDLLDILVRCKLVITDSGGIQEEASFLNKKVIVCRQTTERPEGIETGHLHLCYQPYSLKELFNNLIDNYYIDADCPYGDGKSAHRIKEILRLVKMK